MHFHTNLTSPMITISCGYIYVLIISILFQYMELYKNNTFFHWGCPVLIFGHTIEDKYTFNILLGIFFFHQLINNWINNVVYAWIINVIQDPKEKELGYSKGISLLIVNMFALYSELDLIFIIIGASSQLSFFTMIILANTISTTLINWKYIQHKYGTKKSQSNIHINSSQNLRYDIDFP